MDDAKLISDLRLLEAYAAQMQAKAYSVRKQLERVYAPAPSGKRKALSDAERAKMLGKFRKSITKKAASGN